MKLTNKESIVDLLISTGKVSRNDTRRNSIKGCGKIIASLVKKGWVIKGEYQMEQTLFGTVKDYVYRVEKIPEIW
jgi:hypothetical protein